MAGSVKVSALSVVTGGLGILDPYFSYKSYKDQGNSEGAALAKAGVEAAGWAVAPWAMGAKTAADIGGAAILGLSGVGKQQGKTLSSAYKANFGGNYVDTQNAYTMRQRGMQAIQNNSMNVHSVMGSEARMMARR